MQDLIKDAIDLDGSTELNNRYVYEVVDSGRMVAIISTNKIGRPPVEFYHRVRW